MSSGHYLASNCKSVSTVSALNDIADVANGKHQTRKLLVCRALRRRIGFLQWTGKYRLDLPNAALVSGGSPTRLTTVVITRPLAVLFDLRPAMIGFKLTIAYDNELR